MEVVCRCTSCDTQFKVDEKYAGRKAKCPKCATVVLVPGTASEAASGVFVKPQMPSAASAAPSPASAAPPPARQAATASAVMTKPQPAAPAPKSASSEKIEINVGSVRAPSPASATPEKVAIGVAATAPSVSVASSPEKVTINIAASASSAPTPAGPIVAVDTIAAVSTATSSATPAAKSAKPAKPKAKQKSSILPIIGGGVAALVIVGAFFGIVSFFNGAKGPITSGKPVLVIDLGTAEREDAAITIDGKKQKVPASGAVKFELAAGEHTLAIQRRGYEPIEETLTLKSGRLPFKAKWKEIAGLASGTTPNNPSSPPPGSSFAPAGQSGVSGYAGWLQNLEVAQRRAREGSKDLLLVFVASDSSEPCKALLRDVFVTPSFRELADAKFIPVVIDLPRTSAAYNMIEDRAQNDRLQMQYHVSEETLPAVVLVDTKGKPYAMHESYAGGQGTQYLDKLKKSLEDRAERDRILGLPKSAAGEARLTAAREAAEWLQKRKITGHFSGEVAGWLAYAKEYDPTNEKGSHEVIFEADWLCRLNDMREGGTGDKLKQHIAELETWQQTRKFKTPDRGARLHLLAAMFLARLNDPTGAARQIELGLACNPQDPKLREGLAAGSAALSQAGQLSSGSGFVVGADGYILTNHHVIEGPGKVAVRLSDAKKDTIPGTVLAQDAARDMALVKVALPEGMKLQPVTISIAEMRRGARVAAFGFPLGDAIGQGLKLTQGAIGALADPSNQGMMLLDMRVNPGNSGGPLCDARGNVIGLVTAKIGGGGADSYGLARSTPDLIDFLKKNMPGYVAPVAEKKEEGLEWDEVDRIMSPSVVMILKMEH